MLVSTGGSLKAAMFQERPIRENFDGPNAGGYADSLACCEEFEALGMAYFGSCAENTAVLPGADEYAVSAS
jgi:hypothetical protein